MHFLKFFPLFIFLYFLSVTHAATFDIINRCTYTVWAAASPGGGRRLDSGQTWSINVNPGTTMGRIWGRTNCNFDGNGQGKCQTGDCNGRLQCQGFGSAPNTLAEFALNQPNNLDFVDISLVDGFNIPMEFSPINGGCRKLQCSADINGQCPSELRAPGGCNNPCRVFKTKEYCCTNGSGSCSPTDFSRFFKQRCPDAYSYPQDDPTSMFTCPAGTNYKVVFCPEADTIIDIQNNCPFTVWAAAVPGGGRRLEYGRTWKIKANTKNGRIWGRTNCNFNSLGKGQCQTGDCNGLLECQAYGTPPNTLAEYAINQFNNTDFLGISLVDGFNIPMEFSPVSADECSVRITCTADIIGQCPNELRTPGGCNNPCTVFKTNEYCCTSGTCGPTKYSRFFKDKCSTSYSYALDSSTSAFFCPGGTSYRVLVRFVSKVPTGFGNSSLVPQSDVNEVHASN
ncbi:hypothetical protein KY284_010077 [Solanum tuberosum]|nr:hypothetical protein KY284_010077 [Solanum tuberosum]